MLMLDNLQDRKVDMPCQDSFSENLEFYSLSLGETHDCILHMNDEEKKSLWSANAVILIFV